MIYFAAFIIIVVAILLIIIERRRHKHLIKLWQQYCHSLNGSDKRAALAAGRAYYSALRGDQVLTMYDEQAIANDLATMK